MQHLLERSQAIPRTCFLLAIATTVSCASLAHADSDLAYRPWKNCKLIDERWQYRETDSPELPSDDKKFDWVNLPHTWNAHDTLEMKKYRRGQSWYRKFLTFSNSELKDRHYLRFGAAGQQAKVYVNGNYCGDHRGGYAAFTFEITDFLRPGTNRVDVWVSNSEDLNLSPIDADFNFYGGLYRSVQLIRAPQVSISRLVKGGPGVRVWSESVSSTSADLFAEVVVDNNTEHQIEYSLQAELRDSMGRVVSFAEQNFSADKSTTINMTFPPVLSPKLWSPESPSLYELSVKLIKGSRTLDEAIVLHGFRWYKFDATGEFQLNGKKLKLHGVNRHQDLQGYGNAVTKEHHEQDIKLVKELGANWIRLAHYQQDDYVLDLCDKYGLLVWEEIPFINVFTEDKTFQDNCEVMLREMIEQHHNHPSIILWGVQNEILLKQPGKFHPEKLGLTKFLVNVAREADPRRLVVQAGHGSELYHEVGLPPVTDVMGYNVYFGWYDGMPDDLTPVVNSYHQSRPNCPHVISEYGAGSDIRIHSENPSKQDFSEEWQVHFLERYLDQFESMPVCGTLLWNLFDFGASHRGDTVPHVNQKGVIAFDHKTKKDAWYFLKSRWSQEPVLYLASPRFTERSGNPTKSYRVFTNFDEVELFHQGKSLGKQKNNFQWIVVLKPGENKLLAKGHKGKLHDQHGFTVNYLEYEKDVDPSNQTAQKSIDNRE